MKIEFQLWDAIDKLYVYKNQFYTLGALDALRLQGFDKIKNLENKIIGLKKQDILKQCGNAMSVNVIENLAFNLLRIWKWIQLN